jgi:hypothetical protein
MKAVISAAALALAFIAPAAQARVVKHHAASHVSSGVKAQAAADKKVTKTKHRKHAKKAHKKAA